MKCFQCSEEIRSEFQQAILKDGNNQKQTRAFHPACFDTFLRTKDDTYTVVAAESLKSLPGSQN